MRAKVLVNPVALSRALAAFAASLGLACADPPHKPLDGVVALTLGLRGCAITQSGRASCFLPGLVSAGAVIAEPVPLEEQVISIASGNEATCAVVVSGDVYCWGRNRHGEVGVGDLVQRDEPTLVPNIRNATAVAIGTGSGHGSFVCVVHDAGLVSCWGLNTRGQTGATPDDPALCEANHSSELTAPCILTPTQVPGLDAVTELALGEYHACALRDTGEVWCWGDDSTWQLGDFPGGPPFPPRPYNQGRVGAPTRAEGIEALKISAGKDNTCAIVDDGERLVCWGRADSRHDSMIGDYRSSLRAGYVMDGNEDLHDVGVGYGFTCATWGRPKTSVDCWGTETPMDAHAFATEIAAHRNWVCAIVDGQVWCWGDGKRFVVQVPS